MKICILYIGIGRYIDFWDGFYRSCEEKFIPGAEKTYLLYTDKDIDFDYQENVSVIKKEDLGWPLNTLLRFKYFLDEKESIEKNEYVFFFNANALFNEVVSERDVIPTCQDNWLVGVEHPGYEAWRRFFLPYEKRNKKSKAYLKPKSESIYYQGCLNGGRMHEYMELLTHCHECIMSDLKDNYIARAHDESHLNKYFDINPPRKLSSLYATPSKSSKQGVKIFMRSKEELGWYSGIKSKISTHGGIRSKVKGVFKTLVVEK